MKEKNVKLDELYVISINEKTGHTFGDFGLKDVSTFLNYSPAFIKTEANGFKIFTLPKGEIVSSNTTFTQGKGANRIFAGEVYKFVEIADKLRPYIWDMIPKEGKLSRSEFEMLKGEIYSCEKDFFEKN